MDGQLDDEDIRRERRAERLRRAYEALGKEQNGIFESLAEYTHEVQAEVRALQIARDRLSAERGSIAASGDTSSTVVRIGQPLILGERWVSWEAATAGVVICGVLGVILGLRGSQGGGGTRKKSNRRRVHQD